MDNAEQRPLLSIVIPAYNEESRLLPTLQKIADFLRRQPYTAEILVVENGSTDNTSEVVRRFCAQAIRPDDPFELHLLHTAQGKGVAVKHGMLAAKGDYLVMSDADLAVPIENVNQFLPPVLDPHKYDIAIASREVAGSVRHGEPFYRHLMGRVFNFLVRMLAVPGIQDTQCGFKCFSRQAAQLIFPLQRMEGWGFDVEVLHIAARHGLCMVEIPVEWYYGDNSRVRPVHDTLTTVTELLKIRLNGRRGYYDKPPIQPLVDELPAA